MLDSWREGATKQALIEFIESASTPGEGHIPVPERLATFDLDGTLWPEKPHYVQAEFLLRHVAELPEGRRRRFRDALVALPDLAAGVADLTRGITASEFEDMVCGFFSTAVHPVLARNHTELAYRPMIELIDLLVERSFDVYICTGAGRDFVRPISERLFGVPRDRVIGSAGSIEYRDGAIYRKKGIDLPLAEGPGKPEHIWKRVGRMPVFACGNSDGDIEMLETARFGLVIHHDDAEREFAYEDKAEQFLRAAGDRGWLAVSMRDDWERVFEE